MFSHIMVGTNDIERSKHFYDAVLGMLGAGEGVREHARPAATSACSTATTAAASA